MDKLCLSAVDLPDAALYFKAPSLFDIRISWTIQRLNQRKGEFGTLGIGELGRLFL